MQTRPNPALRKSNSLGSLPNHSAVDEHADHACGMQLDPSPPTNRSKSLHTLPLEQLRADYFGKRLEVCNVGAFDPPMFLHPDSKPSCPAV